MEIKVTDKYTEVYVSGGGNWLTQSRRTNHHGWWRRKVLVGMERPEDFMEVTAAEKRSIEAADARWSRPEQWLIDEAAMYGVPWNEETGFFELNGFTDIGAKEMTVILRNKQVMPSPIRIDNVEQRTNLLVSSSLSGVDANPDLNNLFRGNQLEVIDLEDRYHIRPSNVAHMIRQSSSPQLREVRGIINAGLITGVEFCMFDQGQCVWAKLTTLLLEKIRTDVDLSMCPALSVESVGFLVVNAINTREITVKVHEDVWAKLMAYDKPVNLVVGGDRPEYRGTVYNFCNFEYDNRDLMVAGVSYSVAADYRIGGDDTVISANSGGGYGASVRFDEKPGGVETKVLVHREPVLPEGAGHCLALFNSVYGGDYSEDTCVNWVVVTLSEVEVTEWVPAVSEIEGEEEREMARWAVVRELARARNIRFVTV